MVFIRSCWNNLIYSAITIPASIIIALVMALFVHNRMAGTVPSCVWPFFTPTVLPMIAVGNIWLFFYTPSFGLIDQIRGLFGLPAQNWMGKHRHGALHGSGGCCLEECRFLHDLLSRRATGPSPTQLREAASLEGGRALDLLSPRDGATDHADDPCSSWSNAIINSVRLIDHIFIMTQGGPNNASRLLLYHIYEVAFEYWDTAPASAMTVVILAVLSLLAIGQFFWLDRKVHYR